MIFSTSQTTVQKIDTDLDAAIKGKSLALLLLLRQEGFLSQDQYIKIIALHASFDVNKLISKLEDILKGVCFKHLLEMTFCYLIHFMECWK